MPLDISVTAGTYFIEVDGIRGNNISLIRNADGTFVMPFVHPADSLGFYALEPGVNFVFNFSDFLSTAGALSPRGDWRAPSDASAAVWLEELRANVPG